MHLRADRRNQETPELIDIAPVRLVVVGHHSHLGEYLRAFEQNATLEVAWVTSDAPEAVPAGTNDPGRGRLVSLSAALADDDVEIVVNLARPEVHEFVTTQAIAAGKHVWSERPFAPGIAATEALIDAADQQGVRLSNGTGDISDPELQNLFARVESGSIGEPVSAHLVDRRVGPHAWHPDPASYYQRGSGPLVELAPRLITIAMELLGEPRSVLAIGHRVDVAKVVAVGPLADEEIAVGVATSVNMILGFDEGRSATILTSFDARRTELLRIEVTGTDGVIRPTELGPRPEVTWQEPGASGSWAADGVAAVAAVREFSDAAQEHRGAAEERLLGRRIARVLEAAERSLATSASVLIGRRPEEGVR